MAPEASLNLDCFCKGKGDIPIISLRAPFAEPLVYQRLSAIKCEALAQGIVDKATAVKQLLTIDPGTTDRGGKLVAGEG